MDGDHAARSLIVVGDPDRDVADDPAPLQVLLGDVLQAAVQPANGVPDLAEVQAGVLVDMDLAERVAEPLERLSGLVLLLVLGDDDELAAELDVAPADGLQVDAVVLEAAEAAARRRAVS